MANQIHVIHPYWDGPLLVFDDASVGLRREPFVGNADDILRLLSLDVDGCQEKFSLLFSDAPFPGHQTVIKKLREEYGGNWYGIENSWLEGWLCPALFKYYPVAPERLFLEIRTSQESQP